MSESTTKDLDALKVRYYDVAINDTDVGYTEEPLVEIEQVLKPIKLGQFMDQVMGQRIMGVKATVSVSLLQVDADAVAQAFPWAASATSAPLMPATLGTDNYAYAQKVTFHPQDLLASDTSEDITLLKAVSVGKAVFKGDGSKETAFPMQLEAYPDRSQLPSFVLGYLGAVPSAPTTPPPS